MHAPRGRSEADGVELLVGERPQGPLSRQLFLGDTLDTDRIKAEYTDGVLTRRLPVAEKVKPRRVPIDVSEKSRAIDAHAHDDDRENAGV